MKQCVFLTVAALVIVGLCGSGCKVDQKSEVAAYRKVIDLPLPRIVKGRPLMLRDAVLLANQNNETLSVQGEVFLRSLIERRRAAASFLPTVDVIGSYEKAHASGNSGFQESANIGADLNWTLFQGFSNTNRYWHDTFIIEQRRNDLLAAQESLLLDVAVAFYQVLRSEALVRVLGNSVAVQESRFSDTKSKLEAGVARALDLSQTQAQLAATRTRMVNARRDVHNTRLLLALLTGYPVADAVLGDGYVVSPSVAPVEEMLSTAKESRHGLLAADAAVSAARRQVEVAWGQYYPTVSLNLQSLLRSDAPEGLDWDSVLVASVPVFSAGRIHAEVRAAWSFFREAVLLRSYLYRQVDREVREGYGNFLASGQRMQELYVQTDAALQAFEQADALYQAGLATNLDRITAQDVLLEAQLQLASEEFDRKVYYLTLLRAAGMMRTEMSPTR